MNNNTSLNLKGATVDLYKTKKAHLVFRAINHKLRHKILELLDQNDKITVTEIYIALRLEQSVASQHLAILRSAGIVTTKRNGKYILYSINYEKLNLIQKKAEELTA